MDGLLSWSKKPDSRGRVPMVITRYAGEVTVSPSSNSRMLGMAVLVEAMLVAIQLGKG